MIFFWSLVIKNLQQSISLRDISSYFLIATGIKELVMAEYGEYSSLLGKTISTGGINSYLMRPTNIIFTLYMTALGKDGLPLIISLVMIIIGIVINPPQSMTAVLLFITFLINAWAIAFAYNLIAGSLHFHTPDASGIRSSITHVTRVFSGAIVPVSLFPLWIKDIALLSPFPSMIYGPAMALKTNSITSETLTFLYTAIFWSISLNLLAFYFWKRSIRKYEAVGI